MWVFLSVVRCSFVSAAAAACFLAVSLALRYVALKLQAIWLQFSFAKLFVPLAVYWFLCLSMFLKHKKTYVEKNLQIEDIDGR